jgi:hypothetical protein
MVSLNQFNVVRTLNKQQIGPLQQNTLEKRKLSEIVHSVLFINLWRRLSGRMKYKVTYEKFVLLVANVENIIYINRQNRLAVLMQLSKFYGCVSVHKSG